ncbi:hypothetical protein Tco_0716068 [Tanacetum coccineum]
MAESSSPDITPKEELVTLDKPKTPNLFLPATQVDYAKIIWDDLIHKLNKKTREKIVPYPRFISLLLEHMAPEYGNEELTINPTQVFSVHNLTLKPNQPEEPPFTDHIKAICNLHVLVDSKAPKYSSPTKKKETKSSSAMDTSPSHPSPPTPVVSEMHKEAQQAASGLTSLGDTSEDGAHPQLSSKSKADEISKKVKLEDLSDILKDTRFAFFTLDSPTDEPIIVSDESEEKEAKKAEQPPATSQEVPEDTSVLHPSSLKSTQIQELMAQVHLLQSRKKELEHQKAAAEAEAEAASLKAKPLYPDINQLTTL